MIDEVIIERKSTREYIERSVSLNAIYEIIDIARFAPSGKNRQPWKLHILENEEKKKLVKFIQAKYHDDFPGSLKISLAAMIQCDKIILVYNPYSYQEENYTRNRLLMDTQSIGAFIQNFLLLAEDRKISTLWINDIYYVKEEIEKQYTGNLFEIIAAIAVGYKSKDTKHNIRKELQEIIF